MNESIIYAIAIIILVAILGFILDVKVSVSFDRKKGHWLKPTTWINVEVNKDK